MRFTGGSRERRGKTILSKLTLCDLSELLFKWIGLTACAEVRSNQSDITGGNKGNGGDGYGLQEEAEGAEDNPVCVN